MFLKIWMRANRRYCRPFCCHIMHGEFPFPSFSL
jgi:hypothetical protein